MLAIGIRLFILFAAAGLLAGEAYAAPPSGPIPLPRARPAIKPDKAGKAAAAKPTADKDAAHETAMRGSPAAPLATPALRGATTASIPAPPILVNAPPRASAIPTAPWPQAIMPSSRPPLHPAPALAMATTSATSPMDIAAVKRAVELVHKDRPDDATDVERTISDPVARKLVEWIILRSDNNALDFSRYAAFIATNPSWPSIVTLRRRAEAALWQQNLGPQAVLSFFASEPPRSAKGRFALARALLPQGDTAGAQAQLRQAWREDSFSADLEAQARDAFGGLITPADDKARMDTRLYVEDDDAALRAAQHLDAVEFAVAKARAAVVNKSGNAKALLDALPEAARHDAGYIFSRVQWLRRSDKITEAAQWMAAAPHDPAKLGDLDQWWVERRLVARKLLDLGDVKLAYEVANSAVPPANENYRAEQQFTAGWIALRFLREPAIALPHFAQIAEGVVNPITLARSFYWQGRAAEALGRGQDARAHYEAAAHYPTAYYGQLARARLGLDDVAYARCPRRLPIAATSRSHALSKFFTPSTSAILSPAWPPTSATRQPTPPRSLRLPISLPATTTRGRHCSSARPLLATACRSRLSHFRTSACRTISRSGLKSNVASSIRSCARKAPSTHGSSPALMRSA